MMIFFPLVFLGGCANAIDTENEVMLISPEEVKSMMEENEDFTLVDVRTQAEYDEGHIPGSILIPVDELEERAEEILTDKDAKIVIYCRTGNRTKAAGEILKRLGYRNLYDLGGIVDWPYETTR